MPQNVWFIAAIWMGLAFAASLISIWTGIAVALIEILVGVIAGNFLGVHATTEWINFLALLGTISALFGLQNKIIDQRQYTILVTVVILSAFVPTLIAQTFFQPTVEAMHAWGRLYRKRLGVLSVEDREDANSLTD